MLNRKSTKKIVKFSVFFIFIFFIFLYSLFSTHSLILGPSIEIYEPQKNSFSTSSIEIRGKADRTQDVTINGKSIVMDEKGFFKEDAILKDGYNIFTIKANDRIKRNREYRLEIFNKLK